MKRKITHIVYKSSNWNNVRGRMSCVYCGNVSKIILIKNTKLAYIVKCLHCGKIEELNKKLYVIK